MSNDPFASLESAGENKSKNPDRRCVTPVPHEAPRPPHYHPTLGAPSERWTYLDEAGELLGYVCRFEEHGGGKSFRPLCLFEEAGNNLMWRWESWPAPRPLYGLDRLANQTDAPVLICEGEKSADAAQQISPSYVAITSPGGSKGAGKADWSPIADRDVVIWPDADEPGTEYAKTVIQLLRDIGVRSISVISAPGNVATGWDAGDALEEGWTEDQVAALISAALPCRLKQKSKRKQKDERKAPRQRDALLAAAEPADIGTHRKAGPTPPCPSMATWSTGGWSRRLSSDGLPVGSMKRPEAHPADSNSPMPCGCSMFGRSNQGPCHKPMMRTGAEDGALWLDLCDSRWRAVKITAEGWSVVEQPPVKFVRNEIMAPLPDPEGGGHD